MTRNYQKRDNMRHYLSIFLYEFTRDSIADVKLGQSYAQDVCNAAGIWA